MALLIAMPNGMIYANRILGIFISSWCGQALIYLSSGSTECAEHQ